VGSRALLLMADVVEAGKLHVAYCILHTAYTFHARAPRLTYYCVMVEVMPRPAGRCAPEGVVQTVVVPSRREA
jgi:hypothetical protein